MMGSWETATFERRMMGHGRSEVARPVGGTPARGGQADGARAWKSDRVYGIGVGTDGEWCCVEICAVQSLKRASSGGFEGINSAGWYVAAGEKLCSDHRNHARL
jgi:hypothetical protein